jgi:RecQ family ATP-dependent DNA helicase
MDKAKLDAVLAKFNIKQLKDKQVQILNAHIIEKRDLLAVLATGYGKSICYQMPAFYLNKIGIIVSPLISLIEDQMSGLKKLGIPACCFNSTVKNKQEVRKDILGLKYNLVFLTPEFIVSSGENLLKEINEEIGICGFYVDEAHCLSHWGNDFRKSYKQLDCLKEWFPSIPIMAVTATATLEVEKDICSSLKLQKPLVVKTTFDRPNISLAVKNKTTMSNDLLPIINANESTIIYCKTRKLTEKVAKFLTAHKIECEAYHAGLSDNERSEIHHRFLNDDIMVICATISFGLGINKPDIRLLINYGAPSTVEEYIQQIGRSSRDGKPARSIVYFERSNFSTNRYFLKDIKDENYRNKQQKLLQVMERYLYTKNCRRKEILAHFNEDYNLKNDNCCDNCDNAKLELKKKAKNPLLATKIEDDYTQDASILMGIIYENNGRFGLNTFINIVRGSKSKAIPEKYFLSKFYGKGGKKPISFWQMLGQNMLNGGYIEEKAITGSFGSTLVMGEKGIKWLKSTDKTFTL